MENNNWSWYENASSNGSNNYYGQQNETDRKAKKKAVTWGQLIACMLVMALLGGGLGAGAVYFSNRNATAPADPQLDASGSDINPLTPPYSPDDFSNIPDWPEQHPALGGEGDNPSDGINIVPDGSTQAANDGNTGAIIRACMSSVVGIDIEQEISYGYGMYYNQQGTTSETVGSGSGVIITADGYIVTNNHVIEGADAIKVHLEDGTEYVATLVGADSYTDLAVIKIEATGLPAATLGVSADVLVCDAVYAIGNPLGVFASSVSDGIISGLDRVITIDDIEMTVMQTTAAVNPGNSGGGLFNSAGQLIGIVNAKSTGNNVEGLGFAIPIDSAKPIVTDLIDLGFVSGRPYLGISMQNISIRTNSNSGNSGGFFPFGSFGSYGYVNRVQVMSVEPGSAAEQAGMQANDIIVAMNGTEINGSSALGIMLYEYKVGDTVTITVQRGAELVDLSVTLGERTRTN